MDSNLSSSLVFQPRGRRSHFRPWKSRGSRGRQRAFQEVNNTNSLQTGEVHDELNNELVPMCSQSLDNQENVVRQQNEPTNLDQQTSQPEVNMTIHRRARGGRRIRPTNYAHNYPTDSQPLTNEFTSKNRGLIPRRQRGRQPNRLDSNSHNNDNTSALIREESVSKLTETSTNVQSEIVERQLKTNNFECMICCDNISRTHQTWYCNNCYNLFHLKCAIEWCNKSIKSRNEALASAQYPSLGQIVPSRPITNLQDSQNINNNARDQLKRPETVEWPCPACRVLLYFRPNKYKCFCGKVVRPDVNRHLTPHSCGQLCGRKRPNFECPHNCNNICHPGKCATCLLSSKRSCFCGKVTKEVKCSIGNYSCDEVCGKLLSCEAHRCDKLCHSGSCSTCEQIVIIKCHCGDQEIQELCVNMKEGKKDNLFSCGKICGKKLDCDKHFCNQKCHPGPDCGSCQQLSQNIKSCPCGSTLIKKSVLSQRLSCEDPIPTCDNKCNRQLICGPDKNHHKCRKKCHSGSCPPCKLKSTVHCECRLSTKTIECNLMYEKIEVDEQVKFKQVEFIFSCESRCNKLKNCGRHRCNRKCCKSIKTSDPSLHKCDQKCNRKLACGLHSCEEICHPGQCGDCTNIGWEELTCHCGSSVLYPPIQCGAKPPTCHRPCRRAHNCGHPVKHECHGGSETCAPCIVFVKKSCFCGSDTKDSVYCYLPGYSCGRTCKKLLSCKQHSCRRVCHENDCEAPNDRGVIVCTQPCPNQRFSCKHTCGLPCHGKTPCIASECKKMLTVTCECGNKTDRLECYKIMKDVDNRNKIAMLSTNRSNQDPIIVDLSKKPQSSSDETNDVLKRLECDETCSVLKRNKALAEALEIAQPDLKPVTVFGEDPLRLLKEATAQDYKFVSATFTSLVRFVKTAKESEKRFIFMQFPPAEKLRREVVHELAYHFNCTSESVDDEPFRHVVVRAYKNKSTVPDFNIEQLLPLSD